jgi:outer membrane protein OmpA-like peptidoglycan-associated protein
LITIGFWSDTDSPSRSNALTERSQRRMLRLLLVSILLAGSLSLVTSPCCSETLPDTVTSMQPAAADSSSQAQSVPLRSLRAGGVRIRSVHDNRRIIILRPRTPLIAVLPAPDSVSRYQGVTKQDLEQLERRLKRYLDERVGGSAVLQQPPVGTLLSSPGRFVLVPNSSGGTDILFLPITEFRAPLVDTAGVDTSRALSALGAADTTGVLAPDTTSVPALVTPRVFESVVDVVEVERAILETGLLRTVSILFSTNSAELLPASVPALNSLGYVLEKYPDLQLEIAGHTDSSGPEEYNLQLSERRAEAVRDYLVSNFSVEPGRLVARGYGEIRPLEKESTATGRALNRRVEFTVLGSYEESERE